MAEPVAATGQPGMTGMMGYGIDPRYQANQDKQWQLAAALSAMPDSGITKGLMNDSAPDGQMVSGHYVAPSITQQMSGLAGNALGASLMKKRNLQAQDLIAALRGNQGGGVPAAQMPGETIGQQGMNNAPVIA